MKHLLPRVEKYFKTNLHTHSTISDGKLSPEEVKAGYKAKGYQVLCLTDHNVIIDHSAMNDPDFLMLTGMEINYNAVPYRRLDGKTYHFNLIAKRPDNVWTPWNVRSNYPNSQEYAKLMECENMDIRYDVDATNAMIAKANEKGFLVTYNHPAWSLEYYEDYSKYEGLWAMEYFNSGSDAIGVDENNGWVFREFANMGKRVLPIMADDAHNVYNSRNGYPVLGRAFTMVGAEKLEYGCVMDALARGDLYSSSGPEIHSLTWDQGLLRVTCSPAATIRLIKNSRSFRLAWGEGITEAEFDLRIWYDNAKERGGWFYLLITAADGTYAVTKAYRQEDLAE